MDINLICTELLYFTLIFGSLVTLFFLGMMVKENF